MAYVDEVNADGPLHYWKLGEASGNFVNTVTGGGDMVVSGSVTRSRTGIPGGPDDAIYFDGPTTHDYLYHSSASPSSLSGNSTIEFWAKPNFNSTTAGAWIPIGSRGPNDYSFDIQFWNSDGASPKIHGDFGTGTAWITNTADAAFTWTQGEWAHIVYTLDDTNDRYIIYINGTQAASGALSGTPLIYGANHILDIGHHGTTGNEFLGDIDEVAIYNKVLSATRIQAHYDAGITAPGNPTISVPVMTATASALTPDRVGSKGEYYFTVMEDNPVNYFRLGEASGTTADDIGSRNFDITYYNSPTLGAAGVLNDDPDTAVLLDGVDDYIRDATNRSGYDSGPPYSIEVWAYQDTVLNTGSSEVVYSTGDYGILIGTLTEGSGWQLKIGNSSNVWFVDTTIASTYERAKWYMLTLTVDASNNWYFYVNGTQAASGNNTNLGNSRPYKYVGTVSSNRPIGFGRDMGAASFYWTGKLDEASIYTAALSAARVQAHYDAATQADISIAAPVSTATADAPAPAVGAPYLTAVTATATSSAPAPTVDNGKHAYQEAVEADNPLVYLRFDEASGNPVNEGSNGHSFLVAGTIDYSQQGVWTEDDAYLMNAATEYVYAGTNSGTQTDGVVEMWVYPSAFGTIYSTDRLYGVNIALGSSDVTVQIGDASGTVWNYNSTVSHGRTLSLNKWIHSAMVVSGQTWSLYLNGTFAVSGSIAGSDHAALWSYNTQVPYIGYNAVSDVAGLAGRYSEVAIYSSLTAARIDAHYQAADLGGKTVSATLMTGTAQANTPTVTTSVTIAATLATATTVAHTPTVTTAIILSPPVATASADALTPSVSAQRLVEVAAVTATATATALTAVAAIGKTIAGEVATASGLAYAPSITTIRNPILSPDTAKADGALVVPVIQTDVNLTAAVATASGSALAPLVEQVTEIAPPVATGNATMLPIQLGTDTTVAGALATASASFFAPYVGNAIIRPRSLGAHGVMHAPTVKTRLTYSEIVIADGAIADWPLNETEGTNFDDKASGDNDLNLVHVKGTNASIGQTSVMSDHGSSILFPSGADNVAYLQTASNPFNPSTITVEVVYNMQSVEGSDEFLFAFTDKGVRGRVFQENDGSWRLGFYVDVASGTRFVTASINFDFKWTHAAFTYDGKLLSIYVNGVLVGSRSYSDVEVIIYNSAAQFRVGASAAGDSFGGYIDEVVVFNSALPAETVLYHYNETGLIRSTIAAEMATATAGIVAPQVWPTTIYPPAMTASATLIEDISLHRSINIAPGTADTYMYRPSFQNTYLIDVRYMGEADASAHAPSISTTVPDYSLVIDGQDALRAYFRLGDTLTDESGNEYYADAFGTTNSDGGPVEDPNTSTYFDGTDRIELDDRTLHYRQADGVLSLEFWFKTEADHGVMVSGYSDTEPDILRIGIGDVGFGGDAGVVSVYAWDGTLDGGNRVDYDFHTSETYNDGEWHHFAIIIDAEWTTNAYVFVDGEYVTGGGTFGGTVDLQMNHQFLGWVEGDPAAEPFVGYMDEFAVWYGTMGSDNENLPLNHFEVIKHYEAGKHRYMREVLSDSPTYFWRLGEPFTSALDSGYKPPTTGFDKRWEGSFNYAEDDDFSRLGGDTWLYYVNHPSRDVSGAVNGDVNGAVDFNGIDQYMDYRVDTDPKNIKNNFTVELWMSPDDLRQDNGIFTTEWVDTDLAGNQRLSGQYSFDMYLDNTGTLITRIGNGTNWLKTSEVEYPFKAGAWYHVVVTATTDSYTIYVNNIVVDSGALSGAPVLTGLVPATNGYKRFQPRVGFADWFGTPKYFDGRIDEVSLYNVALPADRVRAHYITGAIPPGAVYVEGIGTAEGSAHAPSLTLERTITVNATTAKANARMNPSANVYLGAAMTANADMKLPIITTFTTLTMPVATATAKMNVSYIGKPSAAATSSMPTPTIHAGAKITAARQTASTATYAPTLTTTSGALLTPPVATASASAKAPSVSVNESNDVPVSTATAQANVPTLSAGTKVTVPTTTAVAKAYAPAISGGVTINAALTTANASMNTPGFGSGINAVSTSATGNALAPSVSVHDTIAPAPATATASLPTPGVKADANLAGAVSTASSLAYAPHVSVNESLTLSVATSSARMPSPAISVDDTVSVPTTTANAAAGIPSVSVDADVDGVAAEADALAPVPTLPNKTILAPVSTASASLPTPEKGTKYLAYEADLFVANYSSDLETSNYVSELAT